MKGKSYQASSHIQYFAVPLPPQCAHWGTLPPGEGIYGRSMTAPMDVEATPYREIPTDGMAVLGMTYDFKVAAIGHFPPVRLGKGQDPPLH